ncbi:cytochrome d ubiquinol oxidase subunit II [Tritonibacter litoralis]|nr:cytochrome d ubiquinol oxidase subunit II [Tritonibacter litoralis]
MPVIWAVVVGLLMTGHLVVGGVDLGVGLLLPTARRLRDRAGMLAAVPQGWRGPSLILGAAALLVWALASEQFMHIWPALALPVLGMAAALALRTWAVLHSWSQTRWGGAWGTAFCLGSMAAGFCQGVVLGTVIAVLGQADNGAQSDWMCSVTPLAGVVGVTMVVAEGFLAALWLWRTTTGDLQQRMRYFAGGLGLGALALTGMLAVLLRGT